MGQFTRRARIYPTLTSPSVSKILADMHKNNRKGESRTEHRRDTASGRQITSAKILGRGQFTPSLTSESLCRNPELSFGLMCLFPRPSSEHAQREVDAPAYTVNEIFSRQHKLRSVAIGMFCAEVWRASTCGDAIHGCPKG